MDWITTSVLLDRLQEVDPDAWSLFVARFRQPVVAFARRLGLNEEEAEDAAQETLLAFAKALREGAYDRAQGRLSSWLFGIARHRVLDVARRRRSKEEVVGAREDGSSFWSAVGDERTAADTFEQSWRESVFEACLAQVRKELKAGTVEAFELVALRGLTPEQAAERLGITRNAVFVARHRVVARIRERVQEYEEVSALKA
jgi:RNA polymerase sigma-70 factor (ECF subfamily)